MRLLDLSASNSTVPTKPFEDAPLIGHEHIAGPCNGLNIQPFSATKLPACFCRLTLRPRSIARGSLGCSTTTKTTTESNQSSESPRRTQVSRPYYQPSSILHRLRGRLHGRAIAIPTASQAFRSVSSSTAPASLDASPNSTGFNELSRQTTDPGGSNSGPSVINTTEQRHQTPPRGYSSHSHSSFQSRTTYSTIPYTPRRASAGRLWNPSNSTPRRPSASSQQRRPSTPTIPPIPSQHLVAGSFSVSADPLITGADDGHLLKPHEQRQTKHPESISSSLQIERSESDIQEGSNSARAPSINAGFKFPAPRTSDIEIGSSSDWTDSSESVPPRKLDKGKGKAIMALENEAPRTFSADLERGPEILGPRISNVTAGDGIGSAISSSNSSIMGEEVQGDLGESWGPLHPCYPHLNPHVPTDSVEYATTRIIRIRRDWLLQGDLAPTFSNLYPEILDPAGVSEPEFRRIIDKLNKEVVPAFDPYSFRNVIDGLIGLVTGWIWDDIGMTGTKTRLNNLEKWIEKWNLEMEKTMGSEEGVIPPKLVSLRRTGYMTLDIQIPDPEIAPAPSSAGAGESRTVLPLEPAPVVTA
ncbi:hypothetical protein PT974_08352 [Cladobotryum mycophilum]|uniref:Ras modification protein ERF4 n=1 Tax=Cladobotryum mycophilum TaxID=491253 RepID=A0ABR0SD61_9HYPO